MEFPSSCKVLEARRQAQLGPHHEQSQQVALYSDKNKQKKLLLQHHLEIIMHVQYFA